MIKKILLLSQFFFPDRTGTGRVMGELFSALSETGATVDVVASRQEYGDISGHILPSFEMYGGVRVFRCFRFFYSGKGGAGRIYNYIMVFFCTFWTCLRHGIMRGKDVIVSTSNPPIMPLLGVFLRRKGQKFVYILHDLYPDIAIAMRVVNSKHIFSRVMLAVNRYTFSRADKVIVLGRDMKEYLMKTYHVPEERLLIIENWANEKIIYREKEIGDCFRVVYTGNMGRFHDLETAVAAFRQLPQAELILVGEGAAKKELIERAKGMHNVHFLPFMESDVYQETLAKADALLVSLEANLSGLAVPSKFYTYLAAGRPVIAISDATTEMAMTIRENEIGFIVPHGDMHTFCEAIRFLQENPDVAKKMGGKANVLGMRRYSKSETVKKYMHLFEEALS